MADAKIMTFGELFSATTDVIPDNKAAAVEIEGLDGNDYIKINTTNSSEAVQLVSSGIGRVSIGTHDPYTSINADADNLVVGDGTGSEGITIVCGSSAGDYGSIYFGDPNSGTQGQIRYEQNNEVMSFCTNTSERMRIDINGNVGIKITDPSANLHVTKGSGSPTNLAEVDTQSIVKIQARTDNLDTLHFCNNSAMILQGSDGAGNSTTPKNISLQPFGGDVGIGTTAPEATLDINSDGVATGVAQSLWICNSSSAASMTNTRTNIVFKQAAHGETARFDAGRIQLGTEGNWTGTGSTRNSFMEFSTVEDGAFNPAMRIDSNGGVLIGADAHASAASTVTIEANSTAAQALGILGRSADDISEINFYEYDKTTKLGEIQYRPTLVNIRHRVGDVIFCAGGTAESMKIAADGNVTMNAGLNVANTGALGTDSVAIGSGCTAAGTNAISVGHSAIASNTKSLALGNGANSSSSGAIAMGPSCQSAANNSMAIGTNSARTEGAYSMALGYFSQTKRPFEQTFTSATYGVDKKASSQRKFVSGQCQTTDDTVTTMLDAENSGSTAMLVNTTNCQTTDKSSTTFFNVRVVSTVTGGDEDSDFEIGEFLARSYTFAIKWVYDASTPTISMISDSAGTAIASDATIYAARENVRASNAVISHATNGIVDSITLVADPGDQAGRGAWKFRVKSANAGATIRHSCFVDQVDHILA